MEKQLREKERIAAGRRRVSDEMQKLRNKIEQTQAKVDAFDEENRSGSKLQRLELLKKNLQEDFERVKKELSQRWFHCSNKESAQNWIIIPHFLSRLLCQKSLR